MKLSEQKPPNYTQILEHFDVKDKPVVFTFGDCIWNVPKDYKMPEHLLKHEFIHSKQQGDNPQEWWDKYIADPDFRLEQELEAYAVQYKFVKENFKRSHSDQFLDNIAHDLASEVYGSMIGFNEGQTKIKRLAKLIHE